MKTTGVSCERKFGLLGFLGHPIVEVMKLNLGRDSEARFGQDFEA